MLFRKSISNTSKFFQRTLGSLKSFFSGGSYEKLPKSPRRNPFSGSATTAASDINIQQQTSFNVTNQWDCSINSSTNNNNNSNIQNSIRQRSSPLINIRKKNIKTPSIKQDQDQDQDQKHYDSHEVVQTSTPPAMKKNIINNNGTYYPSKVMINLKKEEDYNYNYNYNNNSTVISGNKESKEGTVKKNYWLVEEKLKELEMLDMSNVDHVLDIEEVLHYYSRLTCPAYLEIVDKFFIEMFSELFGSSTPARRLIRPRSVMIRSS